MHAHLLLLPLLALGATAQTISQPAMQRTRAVWFVQADKPIAAEIGLSFEALPWNDAVNQLWTGAVGTRLPLANGAWAELATFTDLVFGKTTVKGGAYYVVLEKGKNGRSLGLLDASKVRAAQLPPGVAKGLPLVASIPLTHESDEGEVGPLRAVFEPAATGGTVDLVVRYGPHTLRAKGEVKGAATAAPRAQPDPRTASRATFVSSDGRELFAVVDHGTLVWTDAHKQQAAALKVGARWRLGKDWATTLDTNTPLQLGSKKVMPGSWHLTMAKTRDGYELCVSDARADYEGKLDAFAADQVRPVLVVPLQRDSEVAKVDELRIAFVTADKVTRLVITFGGEQFATTVALAKG